MKLILASSSPRRKEILSYLKIPYGVQSADVDETPHAHESPQAIVLRLSRAKAKAVACMSEPHAAIVLAADTTVTLDRLIIGKPKDDTEAEAILKSLRGRTHQVFSGVTLITPSPNERTPASWSAVCETLVYMRAYSDAEIQNYVAGGSPFDKAGAYAIQDAAFHPVARIVGCYLNVMGLPLCEVIRGLNALGAAIDTREPVLHNCLAAHGQPCWA